MMAKMVKAAQADELAPGQARLLKQTASQLPCTMWTTHSVQLTTLARMWEDR